MTTERIKIAEIDHNDEEGVRVELFLVPADEDGPYHVEDEYGWQVLVGLIDRDHAERRLRWLYGGPLWALELQP